MEEPELGEKMMAAERGLERDLVNIQLVRTTTEENWGRKNSSREF